MIDFITALWLGFIGACIGSFLNVVAYRMPLGMSVVWKKSHCPKCKHPIRARDNLPVLGWLILRGRCRDCGEPISPRYAIVEFAMGAAFFILAYVELFTGGANLPGGPMTEFTGIMENVIAPQWDLIGLYAYHATLLCLLASVLLVDRDQQRTPVKLASCALMLGLIPPLVWPHLYPMLPEGTNFASVLLFGLSGLAAGAAFGTLLLFKSTALQKTHSINCLAMLTFVGIFLGWQAVTYLGMLVIVPAIAWGLIRMRFGKPRMPEFKVSISMSLMLLVTFLLLIVWRPITEIVPL